MQLFSSTHTADAASFTIKFHLEQGKILLMQLFSYIHIANAVSLNIQTAAHHLQDLGDIVQEKKNAMQNTDRVKI